MALTFVVNSFALSVIGTLLLTRQYTGLSFDQCYYMVVLCFLLTHYYHDHIIFSERADFSLAQQHTSNGRVRIGGGVVSFTSSDRDRIGEG